MKTLQLTFDTLSCNDESHRIKGYEVLQKILPNVTVRKQAKALPLFNTLPCNDESHRFKGNEVLQTMLNNVVTVKKHCKAFILFNTLSYESYEYSVL